MTADPVVSPADTIRRAIGNPAFKTNYDALVALNALLAVGERDKAEIARLTEAANEVLADAELMAEGTLYHCATDPMYRLIRAVLAGEEDAANG